MRQAQALHVMNQGQSVFLTGPAGSGKTYVLNQFIRRLKRQKKVVAITASTGIAATHIGGTTIHSWSGLGIRDTLSDQDKVWLRDNDRLSKRYNATDVLVIDEVSMLHGKRLDMINEACKLLRDSDEPFGGLQVILTGDLFQLPPVNRGGGPDDFAHTSVAWKELDPKICYITEQHRQQDDQLLEILQAMRGGSLEQLHFEQLQSRIGVPPPGGAALTRLYAHNIDVESINDRHLKAIQDDARSYEMVTSGRAKSVEQLQKSVLAPELLELKKNAEVMFVANNFAQGFVNGTRGRVVDFNNNTPIIALQSGKTVAVEPHSWTLMEDGKERARVTQLPLRLAWAITIHKSQGMSLDAALIDLSRSFAYGMGYVALSRVRSLDGLYLTGLNQVALQLHPDIYEFDAALRRASQTLAQAVGDVREEVEADEQEAEAEVSEVDPTIFEALRAWRLERAKERGVSAFVIAHNKTLETIAIRKPQTEHALLAIPGIGRKFLESYGPQITGLMRSFQPDAESVPAQPDPHEEVLEYITKKGIDLTPEKRAKILRILNDT